MARKNYENQRKTTQKRAEIPQKLTNKREDEQMDNIDSKFERASSVAKIFRKK